VQSPPARGQDWALRCEAGRALGDAFHFKAFPFGGRKVNDDLAAAKACHEVMSAHPHLGHLGGDDNATLAAGERLLVLVGVE
jgi:hypothetical protein